MIIKQITVDLWKLTRSTISFQQFEEEGRALLITLTAGSLPVNVNGADVYFYAKKPDGTIVFNDCAIVDGAKGQVSYTVTAQTCILAGELECFIGITKAGPQHVRTPIFKITVDASLDVSEAVESQSEFTDLITALATLAGFIPSDSLVQDENGLHLVGDEEAPAYPSAYGWDGVNKGFLPFQKSVKFENGGIELDGDSALVGNNKYYGTNDSGVKGFYDFTRATVFALYKKASNQSVANDTNTKITCTSMEYDTASIYDSANQRFKVPAGYSYARVWAQIAWAGYTAGLRRIWITKNGSVPVGWTAEIEYPFNGRNPMLCPLQMSGWVAVSENDFMELWGYQNVTVALNAVANTTFFGIELIK